MTLDALGRGLRGRLILLAGSALLCPCAALALEAPLQRARVAPAAEDAGRSAAPPAGRQSPRLAMAQQAYGLWSQQMLGAVSDNAATAWRGFLGLDQNLGKTYKEQADAAYQGEKLRDAARLYALVLDFTPNDVEVMGKLGFARKETGDYEGAVAVLERAVAASPEEFQLYWWLADAQRMLGHYDASVLNMTKARDLAPADQKSDLGDYVTFTQGLASKEKSWVHFDQHVALANRHDLLRRSRRCAAEYLLAAALAPAESDEVNNANLRVGLAYSNTGIQYSFMKEPDVAIEYYQRALKYFEAGNLTDWRMRTQQNLAVAYIIWAGQDEARKAAHLNKSVEHWEAAFDLAKAREDAEYTRFTRGSLLQTLAALYPTDDPVLMQVREDNRKELPFSGPVTEFSVAAVCMGEIACRLSERDFAGARIVIEMVLPYYEGTNFLLDNEEAVRLRTAAANVYAYQGHHKQALEAASKALEQMKTVRGYMDSDTYNRSDNEKTYRHAVSAFVRAAVNSGDAEAAWTSFERYRSIAQEDLLGSKVRDEAIYTDAVSEAALLQTRLTELHAGLAAAQATGDATQTAFLEERIQKDEARSAWLQQNVQLPAPKSLAYKPLAVEEPAALRAMLPADATLVAYIFDPTGGTALVCTPAGVQGVALEGATDAVLYDLTAQARAALAGDAAAAAPVMEQLHQLLLAPVLPLISTPHLVFAPDEVLRYLPFEALQAGGKSLLDTHTVSYVNSGSYLHHAFRKERVANTQLRALLPDAAYAALLAPALDALPGAERLLEASATETAARDVQGFDLLHVACAADLAAADPMLSVLRLGADGQQDGAFFAAEWLATYSPAATVLLDLDFTLDHRGVRGNDLIAFAEGTVHAGVPAVISNLWTPPAAERAAFLALLYQHLPNQGRAAALTAAKRAFRQQYPASNAWAAYVLWGDYR